MDNDQKQKKSPKVKLNCWEFMMCGREQGGNLADESGVCPAAGDRSWDGIHSGKCGGRICWAVAGTFCDGCAQGSYVEKRPSCLDCDFYQMVQNEEGMANRQTKFLQFIAGQSRSPFFDKMAYRHIKSGYPAAAAAVHFKLCSMRPGTALPGHEPGESGAHTAFAGFQDGG